MQRKRNIQLLVMLAVTVLLTVAVFYLTSTKGEEAVDKSMFKLADLTQVDQVTLMKEGKTVDLTFEGARWRVNGQLADRRMIDVLFATLQQVEPKRPVAASIQDSIDKILEQHGVKVSLFTQSQLQKEFLAGGNVSRTQAYFKNPGNPESFIMVIPGYRVYASGIFELDENGWKDKYVFNFNWKNFQTLKAVYANAKNDFEIARGKDYFEVKGIASDTTKLNDFLDAVSLLTVDQYVNPAEVNRYDSLMQTIPFQKLEVSDISGKTYSLALYETGGSQVLGVMEGQPALLDRRKIGGILKNKNWFMKN